eukprot:5129978-Pleurochrysis_carterae.AAC.1
MRELTFAWWKETEGVQAKSKRGKAVYRKKREKEHRRRGGWMCGGWRFEATTNLLARSEGWREGARGEQVHFAAGRGDVGDAARRGLRLAGASGSASRGSSPIDSTESTSLLLELPVHFRRDLAVRGD